MKEIFGEILALYFASKDVHYLALLKNRWDIHKMTDEIASDLISWLDDIQEIQFLPLDKDFMCSREIFEIALKYAPEKPSDIKTGFNNLTKLINDILNKITKEFDKYPVGTENLIGGFAQELQKKIGFLGKEFKEN